MNIRDFILVGLGGAVGSSLRYLVGKLMGPQADVAWPLHTLAVNVSGSFVLGLFIVMAARQGWPGWWRPLLAVGVLGGYTTFSTLSVECVELALHGRYTSSAAYAAVSLGAGLAAAGAGIAIGRSL